MGLYDRTREALANITQLWRPRAAEIEALFQQALRLPPPEPVAVCHGDLHFRQLLIEHCELTGIVDWVDVCRSDPGVDLSLAWSFLSPGARAAFFDEYGPLSEASLVRARVLAINLRQSSVATRTTKESVRLKTRLSLDSNARYSPSDAWLRRSDVETSVNGELSGRDGRKRRRALLDGRAGGVDDSRGSAASGRVGVEGNVRATTCRSWSRR